MNTTGGTAGGGTTVTGGMATGTAGGASGGAPTVTTGGSSGTPGSGGVMGGTLATGPTGGQGLGGSGTTSGGGSGGASSLGGGGGAGGTGGVGVGGTAGLGGRATTSGGGIGGTSSLGQAGVTTSGGGGGASGLGGAGGSGGTGGTCAAGSTLPCTCDNGMLGSLVCLPSQVYSECVCGTPALMRLRNGVIGTWTGTATAFGNTWPVTFTFDSYTHYSAKSLQAGISALYYGSDDDSPLRLYDITDVQANGDATGTIVIYFFGQRHESRQPPGH